MKDLAHYSFARWVLGKSLRPEQYNIALHQINTLGKRVTSNFPPCCRARETSRRSLSAFIVLCESRCISRSADCEQSAMRESTHEFLSLSPIFILYMRSFEQKRRRRGWKLFETPTGNLCTRDTHSQTWERYHIRHPCEQKLLVLVPAHRRVKNNSGCAAARERCARCITRYWIRGNKVWWEAFNLICFYFSPITSMLFTQTHLHSIDILP